MTETLPPDEDRRSIDALLEEQAREGLDDGPAVSERPLALDTDDANALAAERRLTAVVLAGPVGTGKTSVYAAIYERLSRGPFGGWAFAGSRSIPGLEQRCHWWRRGETYMEHTRAE